jgi:hypothetical protein
MVLAGWTPGSCTDGQDDDGDGFTDCEDPDCWRAEACQCTDEEDNDGDELVDCEDPDCAMAPACCDQRERAPLCCQDGKDNDGDGLVDCEEDPDCAWVSGCCTDGEDNDGDGLADCEDPDCATSTECCADDTLEECGCADGEDNDGDGLIDCLDDDCFGHQDCWDVRNSWLSEKIPYCLDQQRALEMACDESRVERQIDSFECNTWIDLHRTGLPGRFNVDGVISLVDLRADGVVDEEVELDEPLIRGPNRDGEEVDLSKITFYDNGRLDSNISGGAWNAQTTQGKLRGSVKIVFLSDPCLEAGDACDPDQLSSWRTSSSGKMFYTFTLVPQGSRMVLAKDWEVADTDGDGVEDRVAKALVLERR